MLKHRPPVLRAMTPFPYWIDVDQSVAEARELMASHDVSHLPTKRSGELAGMLYAIDVDRADASEKVGAVHRERVPSVTADDALDGVCLMMADEHVAAVLVTRHGALAGILTTTDICRFLGDLLREHFGAPPGSDHVA